MSRCASLAGVAFAASLASGAIAAAQPNFLLILADDWSAPHAGAYGDPYVRTPNFDRLARRGTLFRNAFAAAPLCAPSRAALLTGRAPHTLGYAASQWSRFPDSVATYTDLLEASGWTVGSDGKGWGPGVVAEGMRNPSGTLWPRFDAFLEAKPAGRSFAYWHGSRKPHRPYRKGADPVAHKSLPDGLLPAFLPDLSEVRADLLDYVAEVEAFDREVGEVVRALDAHGLTESSVIVVTSDNGMPFPRAKANVYDAGARVPLLVCDPRMKAAPRFSTELAGLADLAPTFLEAAGVDAPPGTTGQSLLPILRGDAHPPRDAVFVERERHAYARHGNLSYPVRAVRTRDFLYVRNFRPGRWPAGDPEPARPGQEAFADVDASPTKELLCGRLHDRSLAAFVRLALERRPAEELYDLARDPQQLTNVAAERRFAAARDSLRARLDTWMATTGDPRVGEQGQKWPKGDGPIVAFDRAEYLEPEHASSSEAGP